MPTHAHPPDLVIDLHAAATSYTGQGVSVRGYLHYLTRRNLAIRLHDLNPGGGRANFDPGFADLALTPLDAPAPGVWIHVGGGGHLPPWLGQYREVTQAAGRAAAYHLWWELPVMRPEVVAELNKFDAVIASTHFIEDIARRHLRGPAILHAPQPLPIAETPRPPPDRARFGIPDTAFAVLFNYDPNSDPARKNPEGVITAFLQAKTRMPRLHLVLKRMLPQTGASECHPALDQMLAAAKNASGVHVIDDALDSHAMHSLFTSCDAYISLHRAEGLGLGMLEAMHLGLPVVATAYSGNMSFMSGDSACLVPSRLVPVSGSVLPTYRAVADLPAVWAEPDTDAAAAHLVRLATDRAYHHHLGAAASTAAMHWQRQALEFRWLTDLTDIARQRMERAARSRTTPLPY